jgi:hypothetical protein
MIRTNADNPERRLAVGFAGAMRLKPIENRGSEPGSVKHAG